MTRFTLAAMTLMLGAPAFAGGFVEPTTPAPIPVAPVASTDWTGIYFGLQYETSIDGSAQGLQGGAAADFDIDSDAYGAFVGYRHDFGNFVLGGELDYMVGEFDSPDIANITYDIDSLVRLGVEGGYDLGATLVYATLGLAHIDLSVDSALGNASADSNGYFYGIGADFRVTDNLVVGAELLQNEFDDFDADDDLELLTFGLNIAYTF